MKEKRFGRRASHRKKRCLIGHPLPPSGERVAVKQRPVSLHRRSFTSEIYFFFFLAFFLAAMQITSVPFGVHGSLKPIKTEILLLTRSFLKNFRAETNFLFHCVRVLIIYDRVMLPLCLDICRSTAGVLCAFLVPLGRLRIARQFIAGMKSQHAPGPAGTTDDLQTKKFFANIASTVPSGLKNVLDATRR